MKPAGLLLGIALSIAAPELSPVHSQTHSGTSFRKPGTEDDLRFWLENMASHHQFSLSEMAAATGLDTNEISRALEKFQIRPETRPVQPAPRRLHVLPYPGGRHPRIGFLEGAVDPQRETKVTVFTPWDPMSHVVADVPEAIWSNSGLVYLAHTHVPTIWTAQNIELPQLEWERGDQGNLEARRTLPNGIEFGTKVVPKADHVLFEIWLKNGTSATLQDLRVQNCVMLKGAIGFNQQTNANKIFLNPYVACRDSGGKRWIITAWYPGHRTWANAPVPCLHSDPKFPNCAPGETQRLVGWLSFYEGEHIEAEIERIEGTRWRQRN